MTWSLVSVYSVDSKPGSVTYSTKPNHLLLTCVHCLICIDISRVGQNRIYATYTTMFVYRVHNAILEGCLQKRSLLQLFNGSG